ncbi:MAG: DUF4342 domain-containing protein [bacterium]
MTAKKSAAKKSTKKVSRKPILSAKQKEEIKVEGKNVVNKIKALIKEGNVKHLTVKDNKGKTILSLPVTASVIGAILLPPLIVVGAIAALLTECTITVER